MVQSARSRYVLTAFRFGIRKWSPDVIDEIWQLRLKINFNVKDITQTQYALDSAGGELKIRQSFVFKAVGSHVEIVDEMLLY